MRSDAIRPGDVIAGKFRVRAILSRSRGFLVEAFHTEFDQRVVIRILPTSLVDEKEVERFRRETRILAKLESEHVARILDVGSTKDGAFYFARQYLEGQDLAAHIKQRGALPFGEAVLYILQAAEAVAETHAHNIILRELQPQHLFLTQRLGGQQLKLIDFGTAKLMRDAAAPSPGGELTATSMFGMSAYSSPELVRKAKHVDVRTDVWSLGAILYRLLTGRSPFEGEMAALMLAIARDAPVPASRYRGDLPPDIDNIISWALAKDPDGRFANVYGFAHALLPFGGTEGQLLVKRIGEITNAAKQQQRRSYADAAEAAVDRDHPISIDGNDLIEDAATSTDVQPNASPAYRTNAPAAALAQTPAAQAQQSPFERTMYMGAAQPAQAPQGAAAGRSSQPMFAGASAEPFAAPPKPSRPAWQPSPVAEQPARAPQNGAFNAAAAAVAANGALGGTPATLVSQPEVNRLTPHKVKWPEREKMLLAAVTGVVIALAVVVCVVLVVKGRSPSGATASVATAGPETSSTVAADSPGIARVDTPPPPPPPTASASASATPTATAQAEPPPSDTSAQAAPTVAAVQAPTSAPTFAAPSSRKTGTTAVAAAPTQTAAKVKPDPPPPPPVAASGDNGTLVAVAVGGTCAFSVNGASKGTSSSLKLSVKPGTYSVICVPSGGSSKSKSVTVASGATAMAMFRL